MKTVLSILLGFSSGAMVAAGTVTFLAAIGIVPRMAQRTKTEAYIPRYEDAMFLGGAFACLTFYPQLRIPMGNILTGIYGLLCGVFVGVLAVALAEVLNVMPILMRRTRLTHGIRWLLLAFALGKVAGTILYFFIDGFYIL